VLKFMNDKTGGTLCYLGSANCLRISVQDVFIILALSDIQEHIIRRLK